MKNEDNKAVFDLRQLLKLSAENEAELAEFSTVMAAPGFLYDFLRDYVIAHKYEVFDIALLKRFEKALSLEFLPEGPTEGNVCFLQNPEVRDDFKTFFSTGDLLNYIIAVLPYDDQDLSISAEALWAKLPFPNPKTFWKVVQRGRDLRR